MSCQKLFIFLAIFTFFNSANLVFATADHVVINEVLYNPLDVDSGLEWIMLYNPTDSVIDFTGYQLNATSGDYFTFPQYTFSAKSFVKIHWATDGQNTQTDLYTGKNGFSNMSNTSGWVALFKNTDHSKDSIIDYIEYGNEKNTWESTAQDASIWQKGSFITLTQEGNSFRLKNDGEDNNLVSDWQENSMPTPTVTPLPIIPQATATPTRTPTPSKTPTPTKAPTTKPSSSPTPMMKPSATSNSSPTLIATKMPTILKKSPPSATLSSEILGESTIAAEVTDKDPPAIDRPTPKQISHMLLKSKSTSNIWLYVIGGIFLLVCGILLFFRLRKKIEAFE